MKKQHLLDQKRRERQKLIKDKLLQAKTVKLAEKRANKEQYIMEKKQRQYDGTDKDGVFINIHKNLPGRNDKCLCGSGKKFKKCCLAKVTEQIRSQHFETKLQVDANSENLQNIFNSMQMNI